MLKIERTAAIAKARSRTTPGRNRSPQKKGDLDAM
jgi:hypothetical protein